MNQTETHLTIPIRSNQLSMNISIHRTLASEQSKFQTIDIVESSVFGKILLLDGHIQLTTFDERAYHESLVHIPLLTMSNPKRALVVGGGDGGVIRELCRHRTIEHIDMVEIDEAVVRLSRQYMPELSDGAFDDPRVCLRLEDAFAFVKGATEPYDLIVVDSTDTYEDEEGELSEMLFTQAFYADCKRLLAPGGCVVTQADNLVFCPYSLTEISGLFSSVFPNVGSYQALVPSFGGYSGYCWASVDHEIGWDRAEAGMKNSQTSFRYLNPETLRLAFTTINFA